MWDSPLQITLFALALFVAVTAIGGGAAILSGLERNNFPQRWLDGTPFRSFTIPGVMLATIVGGTALAAVIVLPISSDVGTIVSLAAGIILIGWILGEIKLLNTPGVSRTEITYLAIGLAQTAVAAVTLATAS